MLVLYHCANARSFRPLTTLQFQPKPHPVQQRRQVGFCRPGPGRRGLAEACPASRVARCGVASRAVSHTHILHSDPARAWLGLSAPPIRARARNE